MQLTGAQALIKSLEMQHVEVIFGLPGGAILPVYDPILDSSIRHILVRHEQGAGHMAEGYAQVTGRPGVAMVTSGPGATNIVTPLADAIMDSIPIVVITGQVATTAIGTDAFQECHITGITMDITKHNWLVTDAQDMPRVVAEAFHVATTGRPGPVLDRRPQGRLQRPHGLVLAGGDRRARPPRLQAPDRGRPRPRPAGRRADPGRRAPGDLRRRRDPEGPGRRGAAGAGRAHRHPRGHHAHGPGLVPRPPPAVPRDARHARQLHRRHRHAAGRPAHRPREPLRRPGHRQDQRLRPRRQGHPRRHRPRRARQGPAARRRHRRRLPPRDRGAVAGPGGSGIGLCRSGSPASGDRSVPRGGRWPARRRPGDARSLAARGPTSAPGSRS